MRDVVLLFKYRRMKILGSRLARLVEDVLGREETLWKGVDIVIPVPLHPQRRRDRGFNQAGVIAKALARLRNLPFSDKILVKIKNVPQQAGLMAKDRKTNVRGAYRVKRGKDIRGKIVLLVDDVYTTGATIRECSLIMKRSGVREVRAVTVAQA